MLIVISPAKTLDFSPVKQGIKHTLPDYLKESQTIINELLKYTPNDIAELMSVSLSIARLNFERFTEWRLPFSNKNAKQALFTFKGDVYRSMQPNSFTSDEIDFAQEHLRILSGLYGVLRPLDLIQAYRLEMGTRISVNQIQNLYKFWDNKITLNLNNVSKKLRTKTLINLASAEYFKSIQRFGLNLEVITPEFRDERNGKYQMISIYAKLARGLMTRFIIKNKITDPQQIKLFEEDGYQFNTHLSTDLKWVFTRQKGSY